MREEPDLKKVSDDELLRSLGRVLRQSRRVEADLVAHIAEVDERRLYAREAAPSMHAYCIEVLHLSEPETALRIHVARASRKHPMLLEMLRDGRIHLSGIALLAPHLTARNCQSLLKRATHKTKRQIEEIVAALKPRPDVPAGMRRLPPPRSNGDGRTAEDGRSALDVVPRVAPGTIPRSSPDDFGASKSLMGGAMGREHRLDDVRDRPTLEPRPVARVQPLAPARYQVKFTASQELHDKLERLQALIALRFPTATWEPSSTQRSPRSWRGWKPRSWGRRRTRGRAWPRPTRRRPPVTSPPRSGARCGRVTAGGAPTSTRVGGAAKPVKGWSSTMTVRPSPAVEVTASTTSRSRAGPTTS